MPIAKFEEKSFEQPLNHQLLGKNAHLFPPGQVLEKFVGFDVALMSDYPYFWRLWSRKPASGLTPAKAVAPKYATKVPSQSTFRTNIFLQHKRPYHLTTTRSKEWPDWKRSYYRFDLLPHQQLALEGIAQRAGRRALVCYASPAFWTFDELCDHIDKKTLVENTNFCRAEGLAGHGRYSYVSARSKGKRHSEPQEVEPVDLLAEVEASIDQPPHPPRSQSRGDDPDDDDNIFRETGRIIDEVARDQHLHDWWLTRNYNEIVAAMMNVVRDRNIPDVPTVEGFVKTGVFTWLLGSEWLVVGREERWDGD